MMLTLAELPFSNFTVGGTVRLTVDSHFPLSFRRERIKIISQRLIMFLRFKELRSSQGLGTDTRDAGATSDWTTSQIGRAHV